MPGYQKAPADLMLEKAIRFSAFKHGGQKDKAGEPYILHPIRVMALLGHKASETERIVAMLHDVMEDTPTSYDEILGMFGEQVAKCVNTLTKLKEEAYHDYIRRVSQCGIARRVKLADLEDNMDMKRYDWRNDEKAEERYRRYFEAKEALGRYSQ